MQASTFSFRADEVFSEQTRAMAQALGLKSSDYIRQAVTEKTPKSWPSGLLPCHVNWLKSTCG